MGGRKFPLRQSHHEIDERAVFSLNDWQWAKLAKRLLLLAMNLLTLAYFSIPLVGSLLDAQRGGWAGGNSTEAKNGTGGTNPSSPAEAGDAADPSTRQQQNDMMDFLDLMERSITNGSDGMPTMTPPSGISMGMIGMIIVEVAMGHQKVEDLTELKPILR